MSPTLKNNRQVDVLIIGMGPAGVSTALSLVSHGLEVAIVGKRKSSRFKVGESLSPDALMVMKQLGVADILETGEHLPCYGNRSYWGSDIPASNDFIQHINGQGWHINRVQFEEQLLAKLEDTGATLIEDTIIQQCNYNDGVWLCTDRNGSIYRARFLVDASGKNAWLARRMGVEKIWEDRQMALVSWLQCPKAYEEHISWIEAISEGWWYAAGLPGNQLVTLCMLDESRKKETAISVWKAAFAKSDAIANMIQSNEFTLLAEPAWVDASSGYLPHMYGDGWVAVGDAALSYDPIAAHGITMAMVSGRDAGAAIAGTLKGEVGLLAAYQERLKAAFAKYAYQRARIYWQEQRWVYHAYWQQRLANAEAFLMGQGVWEKE